MNILVINSGSSSLKYQLFHMPDEKPLCTGLIEKIGKEDSFIRHKTIDSEGVHVVEKALPVKDFGVGMKHVLALLTDSGLIRNTDDLEVIGHRVVHGGEYFSTAVVINPDVKQKIIGLATLAPLHNPVNYNCIEFAQEIFPNAKQVAVFDTAFHQTMPEYAFRYAIPEKYYSDMHIRAYGFHGTSHKYVSQKAIEWIENPDAKIISIHLGNGCSITAVDAGKSIDTSMGFGPLSGLVMGTRSGDIDPSVILHLQRKEGKTADEMDKLLNNESGLLGLAGSNDMRDVMKMLEAGNYDAELAIDLYAYRIKKYIGSYVAVLNGLDAIVFTAGVGENDALMREKVCNEMEHFRIHLDSESNRVKSDQIREINEKHAPVKILVIPTNEELEIARQSFELLREDPPCEEIILD